MNKPDIVAFLEKEGIELKRKGRRLWALCPLHSESTASFAVDPAKQTFFCFGCHRHGDVITLAMKIKGVSFNDAVSYLEVKNTSARINGRELRKRQLVKEFRQWCYEYHDLLSDCVRILNELKTVIKTEEDLDILTPYYHRESLWLWHLEILESGDDGDKLALYKESEI